MNTKQQLKIFFNIMCHSYNQHKQLAHYTECIGIEDKIHICISLVKIFGYNVQIKTLNKLNGTIKVDIN